MLLVTNTHALGYKINLTWTDTNFIFNLPHTHTHFKTKPLGDKPTNSFPRNFIKAWICHGIQKKKARKLEVPILYMCIQ
jgi:hypothetical protein